MRSTLVSWTAAAVAFCVVALPSGGQDTRPGGPAANGILRELRTKSAIRAVEYFDSLPAGTEITLAIKKAIAPRLRRTGDYARARRMFEDILIADPRDEAATRGLTMTLFDMEDYEAAQRILFEVADGGLHPEVKLPDIVTQIVLPGPVDTTDAGLSAEVAETTAEPPSPVPVETNVTEVAQEVAVEPPPPAPAPAETNVIEVVETIPLERITVAVAGPTQEVAEVVVEPIAIVPEETDVSQQVAEVVVEPVVIVPAETNLADETVAGAVKRVSIVPAETNVVEDEVGSAPVTIIVPETRVVEVEPDTVPEFPETTNVVELVEPCPVTPDMTAHTTAVVVIEPTPTCAVETAGVPLTSIVPEQATPPIQHVAPATGRVVAAVTVDAPLEESVSTPGAPPRIATLEPEEIADHIALLLASNKTEAAVSLFELLPAEKRLSSRLRRSIAGCYEKKGYYVQAARLYESVFDENPDDFETGLAMVDLYTECDQDAAVDAADKVLKHHPRNVPVLFAKARIESVKKDRDEVAALCQRILALDNTHGPAKELCLGVLLSSAREHGKRAAEFYEKALAVEDSADIRRE